jgi:hypothetical protein
MPAAIDRRLHILLRTNTIDKLQLQFRNLISDVAGHFVCFVVNESGHVSEPMATK